VAIAEGAVPALVSGMISHPDSLPLQCVSCAAVRHFTASPRGAEALADAGALEAILAALRLHGSSASLQEVGCDVLADLARCADGGSAAARAALDAGALEVVKAALLTRFPTHPGVQRAAKGALEALSPARLRAGTGAGAGAGGDAFSGEESLAPPPRALCHPALSGLQSRFVAWLGAGGENNDWLDLVELALTSSWQEWETGLSTTGVGGGGGGSVVGPQVPPALPDR
jgi:hypothetical protein